MGLVAHVLGDHALGVSTLYVGGRASIHRPALLHNSQIEDSGGVRWALNYFFVGLPLL